MILVLLAFVPGYGIYKHDNFKFRLCREQLVGGVESFIAFIL